MSKEINDKLAKLKQSLGKSDKKDVENKTEKTEKSEGKKKCKNGGKREGSGRKPLDKELVVKSYRKTVDDFYDEEDEVMVRDKGTQQMKRKKLKKFRILLEAEYKEVKAGNMIAINSAKDRLMGKAPQPLKGDENDDTPIRIGLDITSVLDKGYKDEDDD